MEWTVKNIRSYLGKFASGNMKKRMLNVTGTLATNDSFKNEGFRADGDFEPTTQEYELSVIYCHSRIWSREVRLWDLDSDIHHGKAGERKENDDVLRGPGGQALNPELCYLVCIAQRRLEKYLKEYYLEGELDQDSRPHRVVNLRRIPTLGEEKDSQVKEEEVWSTSVDANELAVFGKADIRANTEYVNGLLPEGKRVKLVAESRKKIDQAKVLVTAREELRKLKRKRVLKKRVQDFDFADKDDKDPPLTIQDELRHPFYNVPVDVENAFDTEEKYKYKVYGHIYPACEDADDASDNESAAAASSSRDPDSQTSSFSLGLGATYY